MTHDEPQNNSSDTGTILPTYKCAFCQGKIVTCNCEKGFKNAVETSLREQLQKNFMAHYYDCAKKESWEEAAVWEHAVHILLGVTIVICGGCNDSR